VFGTSRSVSGYCVNLLANGRDSLVTQTSDLLYRFRIDGWAIAALLLLLWALWRWIALWKLGKVLAPILGVHSPMGARKAQAIVARRIVTRSRTSAACELSSHVISPTSSAVESAHA
jgi:hypothetical protein